MLNAVVPLSRVGMKFIPSVGRGIGTLLTYLGVDAAADFVADLIVSTGRSDWTNSNFSDKFGEIVGSNPAKLLPVAEVAIRAFGAEKVLSMVREIDLSDYDRNEKDQVKSLIEVLEATENTVGDIVGDGDLDEIWGVDKDEFNKNRISNSIAIGYVKTLCATLGTPDDVRAFREAFFKVEDEHLDLYEDMVKAIHG